MRVAIIHHTDLDGSGSAAVVKGYLVTKESLKDEDITFIKYSYGWKLDPEVLNTFDRIYAVDVSFNDNPWVYNYKNLIWIDHHETVVTDHPEIPGLRRIGVGACELCWNYFFPGTPLNPIIDYLSTYDVWDHNRHDWQQVLDVQTGARDKYGNDPDPLLADIMLGSNAIVFDLECRGKMLNDYQNKQYESQAGQFCGYIEDFHGYRTLVLNSCNFCSQAFWSLWDREHFDIMLVWCYSPKMKKFRVSMYTDKEGIDVSKICEKYSGGGHVGAAGCQIFANQWINSILPLIEPVPKFENPDVI